jgi:hypothetical protein
MLKRSHNVPWRVTACTVLLAAMFVLPACGSAGASAPVPVFEIHLGPGYTVNPAEITVPADRFEVLVTNVDPQLPHSLVMLQRSTMQLAPGQSQRLVVKRGQEPVVGDYRMFCDVSGHQQMGQVGVVHVVAATSAASADSVKVSALGRSTH